MTLTERLTRQRKSQSPSLYVTTSNKKKASDKEILNVYKPPWIKASLESYPTPKGRNLCVVIKLETIPEITNLEIAQSSKLASVKPAQNATEDLDYANQPSNASSVKSKNQRAKGSASHSFSSSGIPSINSENIDMSEDSGDSLRDLSWILLMPGLFPLDNEDTEKSSLCRLDEPTSTIPHTSFEQSSISLPVKRDLPFQEKLPTLTPPLVFIDHDAKATNYPTVSKPDLLRMPKVHLPQENPVQPSLSTRPQASLPKDIERPTAELQQKNRLAVASERNTDESSSWPLRPSRTPPVPPKSDKRQRVPATILPPRLPPPVGKPREPDKRQPVPVASPPPRPPTPPWKPRDPDKRPSIQIDDSIQRPPRHPEIPSEPEQRQSGSRGSKRPITQRLFRGCKKFVDDALRLSRSSLRKDSAYSFTPSKIDIDHTQTRPESIKAATRAPPLLPPQSNLSSSSSYQKSCEKDDISTPSSTNSETGTNSTAPSIKSKADTFLSKATSFKLKTKLSRIWSRKDNIQGDMNAGEVALDFPAIKEEYRLPELDFRSRTLLPFQCTMCFMQLNNKADWIQHEKSHNDDYEEMSDWYWRCGICDNILHSWDDRQNHIADEHFEIGQTLSTWNSSTSPYPWNKVSSKPISGFPHWDISKLRSMQPTILDDIYRKINPQNACGVCNLAFPTSSELDQHMKQNHVSWSCPTTTRKRKAAFFFEMCRDGCKNQFHSCRCCYKSFCDDSTDWKQRKQHFEEHHHFLKCDHDQFFEHAQFCHHLASSHGVEIDFLGMTNLCRQKESASS